MSSERWLITGALGCVGAWCCRQLVREGHAVVGLHLESDQRRAQLIMVAGGARDAPLTSRHYVCVYGLSPALAGMTGGRRWWTVSTISRR